MSKGFAHPYLLVAVLVVVGVVFAIFTSSAKLAGFVLGSRTYDLDTYQTKVDGLKVTVLSPTSLWDLMQYLCKTRDECEKSQTSGKWWATVSGASTTEDGHEVFIEKSPGWEGYGFLKVMVRQGGSAGEYLKLEGRNTDSYYIVDIKTSLSIGDVLIFK